MSRPHPTDTHDRQSLPASLREFAEAIDKDRGHGKSYVTLIMREAATELERYQSRPVGVSVGVSSSPAEKQTP